MSLINTSDIRTYMGIAEGDTKPNAKLEAISKSIQAFCDSYTNTRLEAQRYLTDPSFCYFDGDGTNLLYTASQPVSYVSSIHIDNERNFGSNYLLSSDDYFYYPNGKIVSEGQYFSRGRRNVLVDYIAGFAPVVGGTHNAVVSSYPVPLDLKQVMVEMTVASIKEGITAIHGVKGNIGGGSTRSSLSPNMNDILGQNSFWCTVLGKYKDYSGPYSGRWS